MRERAALVGGRLRVQSRPGGGMTVVATVPLSLHGDGVIRILVVDDHPIVRDGLVTVLADQPDIAVVGAAGTAEEAVDMAGRASARRGRCWIWSCPPWAAWRRFHCCAQ